MELRGKVIQSLPLQSGTSKAGKEWKKAEVIVETAENSQYPKKVALTNLKSADEFAALPIGSEWIFKIDLESREFNDRWYTNVNCWGWQPVDATGRQQDLAGQFPPAAPAMNPSSPNDDLPTF